MREAPKPTVIGPEIRDLASIDRPRATRARSLAKAISWRAVGSLDTLILSFLLISYLGPVFGMEPAHNKALHTAGWIATTEIITKTILYYCHERFWERSHWGTKILRGRRRENYRRSTMKTASWRALGSLDTTMLAWLFTGNLATAVSIGGLEVFTKVILYFFHERIWSMASFGLVAQPAAETRIGEPVEA